MKDQAKYRRLIAERENLVTLMERCEALGTENAMVQYDKLAEAYERVEVELEEVIW